MSIVNCLTTDIASHNIRNETNFTMRLKKMLQQMVEFSLLDAIILCTWYPVPDILIKYIFDYPNSDPYIIFIPVDLYTAIDIARS